MQRLITASGRWVRSHAPIVAEHPRFVEIVARLGEPGLLQRLPTDVDWLLCDANIAPDVAVPHLADLCSRCGERRAPSRRPELAL